MWRVKKPTTSSIDSFRTSISKFSNEDLRDRLQSIENDIVQASDEFEAAAASVTLHTLVETDGVAGIVTTQEMINIYERGFVRKNSSDRAIYDAIRSAPAYARCPLCGHGTVWSLDHHLPKTSFPALAVTPVNLVLACMECNKFKLAVIPQNAEEETIHPYFDDIDDDLWLVAEVVEDQPAALRFLVQTPDNWTQVLEKRVKRHFTMLNLPYRYGVEAGREIANLEKILSDLLAKAGIAEVTRHLTDVADGYEAARKNSWQTAMYKALAASDWYCGGGFRL